MSLVGQLEVWPFVVWAAGVSWGFCSLTVFATSILHEDKKAALSLWLEGSYESTWSAQFCRIFDRIFGQKLLRPNGIALSALASVVWVLLLWLLLDQILGVFSFRANSGLTVFQALLLGTVINIVPDYLSLLETRWLLEKFSRIRNPFVQLLVLILDLVVTGFIIYASIGIYLWSTGSPMISLVEMMALFSVYSLFFYSTFFTSIWAWAYCLSSWIARLSGSLRNWLDTSNSPEKILGLFVGLLVFFGLLALQPAFSVDKDGRVAFDDFLCEWFPENICTHVARLTIDEEVKLIYLTRACEGGVKTECFDLVAQYYGIDPDESVRLATISCDLGVAASCMFLGLMYSEGVYVEKNAAYSFDLLSLACNGGNLIGCDSLGHSYLVGFGVEQSFDDAAAIFERACIQGYSQSCANLGHMFTDGLGVTLNFEEALYLFNDACLKNVASGCHGLGVLLWNGHGVERDRVRANNIFSTSCHDDFLPSCEILGYSYEYGFGVEKDIARAEAYYAKACGEASEQDCERRYSDPISFLLSSGHSTSNNTVIIENLRSLCFSEGEARQCSILGVVMENLEGDGSTAAVEAHTEACRLGDGLSCQIASRLVGLD